MLLSCRRAGRPGVPRLESQEARQARMAEDHQLAKVLQDIEATERDWDWVEEPCRYRLRIEIDRFLLHM